ncbi:MAG TPA: pyruvate kinase [Candidatus Binatia bacterium]|nr:pyruvate kinase [Candidatus Binatia bacterium]
MNGRTSLVCTIGPASSGRVGELIEAGMDVARINFSHGTPESRAGAGRGVRSAAEAAGRGVAILADLPGPKIRLGDLATETLTLEAGAAFALRPADARPGDASGAQVSYPRLGADLLRGDRILLSDGAVELRVSETGEREVLTEVVRGGTIRSRAGVSVPSDRLSEPALTDADRTWLPDALELGADYIGQSFVRRAADVSELRTLLGPSGPPIVAKIETRPAVEDFDAICGVADAVMIARGDLGVELPYEEVPILQKQLVRRALDRGVPTIVATQMLESMISAPRPTRAEASDVANAIFDGADAIMLSAETAIGAHPILAAQAAERIARLCEEKGAAHLAAGAPPNAETDADALAYAAVALAAADEDVSAIACYTRSGRTARILSALRPRVPIIAFSPSAVVVRRLALPYGVEARACVPPDGVEGRLGLMAWLVGEDASVPPGSAVVLVASTAGTGTGPNLLEVHRVPG